MLYSALTPLKKLLTTLSPKKKYRGNLPRYFFLQTGNRVVSTFGNFRFGVDISEAVCCLDHNLSRWIFQRIFIHMVALAVGVVCIIFLAQDTEV